MNSKRKTLRAALSSTSMLTLADKLWTGGADSQWDNGSNWGPSGAPINADAVTINGAGSSPIINGTGENAATLIVGNSVGAGILTINNSGLLAVSGDIRSVM